MPERLVQCMIRRCNWVPSETLLEPDRPSRTFGWFLGIQVVARVRVIHEQICTALQWTPPSWNIFPAEINSFKLIVAKSETCRIPKFATQHHKSSPRSRAYIDEYTQTGATLLLIQYSWNALEITKSPRVTSQIPQPTCYWHFGNLTTKLHAQWTWCLGKLRMPQVLQRQWVPE